jgi:hypothetical protein
MLLTLTAKVITKSLNNKVEMDKWIISNHQGNLKLQ